MNMNGRTSDLVTAEITGADWVGKSTGARLGPTREEIARLAYERYEIHGRKDGHDLEDWLVAERELVRHYA